MDDEAIFNLTYLEIHESLKRRIAACDAVVCLIGFYYGGEPADLPPDQPRRSFTQWEYFFAEELGKPVYRLLADEKTSFDAHTPESKRKRQLQLKYRGQVVRNRDWRSFNSVEQLRSELAELRFPWDGPPPDHKPCNLPLASIGTLFKGRESFLAELKQRLGVPGAQPTAIVNKLAVYGLGGVGKTRAALEYAWRYASDYTALLFASATSAAELRANLANLVAVLGIKAETASVDEQLAEVVAWLDAHPGWLLVLDNVDTVEAVREVEQRLPKLRAGHVLITSRIATWSAGVQRLDLDVLESEAAVAFLLERTPLRPYDGLTTLSRAAVVAGKLDGLALALEQAGAYIDTLGYSFTEYLERWDTKRPVVLSWHDVDLMQYPASVAVTWETTFAQLTEPAKRLLEVLAWLAPDPIPLFLFEAAPLAKVIADPRSVLATLRRFSLARFDAAGDAVLVHRLVQEITRGRIPEAERTATLRIALEVVDAVAPADPADVRDWGAWTPLSPHADAISRSADAEGLAEPTAPLMSDVGVYRKSRGQFDAAELLHRRALAIDEASYGPDHPDVARGLNNLAELLLATNRFAEAEPLLRRALAIDEASYGPAHPTVARDLNNLALLLQDTNRLAEAEPLFRRALAIFEASCGPEDPDVAIYLNNLAELLRTTNRLAEAEPLFRRALAIDEALYGPDHPTVAKDLNNLALLLQDTNRLAEAGPLFRRALAIIEASYGPDHPTVAIPLNNLAGLLRATNRLAEAEPLYRRALAIDEASYGPDHPGVAIDLNNLALLLLATNRFAEAEPLYRRALPIAESSYGPDHPTVAKALNNLARLLQETNRLGEAEPLYRRTLVIAELSYGPNHPTVAIALNNLARLLQDTNRLAEAEPLFRRSAQILIEFERRTGHEHPHLRIVIANYRGLLEALEKTPDQIEQDLSELKRQDNFN